MSDELVKLTRADKIILSLKKQLDSGSKIVRFEDLVVELFRSYQDEFHLKGYAEYPDSEVVNNALYHGLKRRGLVLYGNKNFSLTPKGIQYANNLSEKLGDKKLEKTERLTFYISNEVARIKKLDGFRLFNSGKQDEIFDTDFYNYVGVSVRTGKSDFTGRWSNIEEISKYLEAKKKPSELDKQILAYHSYLRNKFKDLLDYYLRSY